MNRHRLPLLPLLSAGVFIGLLAGPLSAAETISVPLADGSTRTLIVDETQVVVRSAAGTARVGIAGLTPAAIRTAQAAGTVLLQTRASDALTVDAGYLMGTTVLVHAASAASAAQLATRHGLVVDAPMNLPGYYVLSAPDPLAAVRALRALQADAQALSAEPNLALPVKPNGADSRGFQWHLPLINATSAWTTSTGIGINIAIVDTGIEASHPRLSNTQTGLGANYAGGTDPGPTWQFDPLFPLRPDPEAHGTFVAGLAGAVDNGSGVVGVAPGSHLVSVKVFDINENTNVDRLVNGLSHNVTVAEASRTHISNNSWGSVLTVSTVDPLPTIGLTALRNGVNNGRGGLGIPYVFASGNDGSITTCDYSGWATNPYVISVGAVSQAGIKATYSEAGANVFICAPVGDPTGIGAVSTDRVGKNGFIVEVSPGGDYSAQADREYGTSFAAPQVAGVVALMLAANPALGWRDVRTILAVTGNSGQIADFGTGGVTNGAGYRFNNSYGFGMVDALQAVQRAQAWIKIPDESTPESTTTTLTSALEIPDASATGATVEFQVNIPGDFTVESVEFTPAVTHSRRGDLSYSLRSAMGTTITVPGRSGDIASAGSFTFCTVGMYDERVNGLWQLTVTDGATGQTGTVSGGTLVFHGFAGALGSFPGGGSGLVPGGTGIGVSAPSNNSTPGVAKFSGDNNSGGSCGAGSSLGLLLVLSWLGGIAFAIRRR